MKLPSNRCTEYSLNPGLNPSKFPKTGHLDSKIKIHKSTNARSKLEKSAEDQAFENSLSGHHEFKRAPLWIPKGTN